MKRFLLASAGLLLSGAAFALSIPGADPRLVGTWQGERPRTTDCLPLSWKVNRMANGRFVMDVFAPGRRHLATLPGRWWVKGDRVFVQADVAKEADEYSFTIQSRDAIEFHLVRASPDADCPNEPPFTDFRIEATQP